MTKRKTIVAAWIFIVLACLAGRSTARGAEAPATDNGSPAPVAADPAAPEGSVREKVVLRDVEVEMTVAPAEGKKVLQAAEYATVEFRVRDPKTGTPVTSLKPGAWMDPADPKGMQCRQKIQQYLQKILTYRPMVDLNSNYILLLNRSASISVIDPIWGLAGISNLYTTIILPSPGEDWVKSPDQKRIFVSMPQAGKVAVVDAENFRVVKEVEAGGMPVRVVLQPDGKYLWAGDDSRKKGESGVTVIDSGELKAIARIPTGAGHHEIDFSDDSAFAFVTNLEEGTVSVIDIRAMKKVKDIETGGRPTAIAFSRLGKAAYVADGEKGTITAVDAGSLEVRARVQVKPGLNFLRFSPDKRFGFATNGNADEVYILDSATNRILHTVDVKGKPYQVIFTDTIAYVRCLGTEFVTMIPLTGMDKVEKVRTTTFAAGNVAPEKASYIGIADTVARSSMETAVLVANQADNFVYYYGEGMTAPMGSWKNYGFELKAVMVLDRSFKERRPGVYSTSVLLPQSGTFDLALLLDSPPATHCFTVTVKENPKVKKVREAYAFEFLKAEDKVPAGASTPLRFRLIDPYTKSPLVEVKDVIVRVMGVVRNFSELRKAKHAGDGVYEATVSTPYPGVYYIYFESRSLKMKYSEAPMLMMRAVEKESRGGDPPLEGKGEIR
jgi:YVTN family beta-propeller protein